MTFKTYLRAAALAAICLFRSHAAPLFLDNGIFGPPPLLLLSLDEFGPVDLEFFPIPNLLAPPQLPGGDVPFSLLFDDFAAGPESEPQSTPFLGLASPVLSVIPDEDVPEASSGILFISGLLGVVLMYGRVSGYRLVSRSRRFSRKSRTPS